MSAPLNPSSPSGNGSPTDVLTQMHGSGTEDSPYIITTARELQAMDSDLSAHFTLGCDIDASETESWNNGRGFKPIGRSEHQTGDAFTGTFNGNGHVIQELVINRPYEDNIGVFGVMRDEACIHDISLVDVKVAGQHNVGSIVGFNDGGQILDSYAESTVIGNHIVGGCVGWNNEGLVAETYGVGITEGEESVGMVVGENWGQVLGVDADGVSKGHNDIGENVGYNDGLIAEVDV